MKDREYASELDLILEEEDEIALRTRLHLLEDRGSQKTEVLSEKVLGMLKDT